MKQFTLLIMLTLASLVSAQKHEFQHDTIIVKTYTFHYTRIIFSKERSLVGEKFFTANAEIASQVADKIAACQKLQHSDYSGAWIIHLNYEQLADSHISEGEVLYAAVCKADKERIEKNLPTYLYRCKIKLNHYYDIEYFLSQPKRTLEEMGQYAFNVTVKDACLKLY